MPRVGTYGGRQVATRPLPAAYKSNAPGPEAFGAGFGRTLTRVAGGVLGEIVARERQTADELAVLNAENSLQEWVAERLYHPESGAFTQRGAAAFGLPETVGGEFDKVAGDIANGLSTERQVAAFQRTRMSRKAALELQLHQFVFRESAAYDQAETERGIQNSVASAVLAASDPRAISQELVRGQKLLEEFGARNGWGPEQRQAALDSFRTDVHQGVIGRLLTEGADQVAQVYFEEVKHQIGGAAIAKIEAALESGTLRGESQRRADAILDQVTTLTEALDQVRAIDDPKLRDETRRRVTEDWALRERAAQEAHEGNLLTAINLVDQRGKVTAIPATLWTTFTTAERASLHNYARARLEGRDVETDLPTYYALMQQASDAPGTFARVNLLSYVGKLGKTEFKQLTELQGRLRQGASIEDKLDDFRTELQVVDQSLRAFGVNPEAKTPDEAATVARIRRIVAERTARTQRATGKKATNADIQAIVDDLLGQEVETPGFLGLTTRTSRLVTIEYDDIPAAERRRAEAVLRDQQRPVTPEAVVETFIANRGLIGMTIRDVPRRDRAEIAEALRARGMAITDEAVIDLYIRTLLRARR